MELEDCASPALQKIIATADLNEGFRDINWALLVGSVSRKPGMERKDLLAINGKIFTGQGQACRKTPPGMSASSSSATRAIPIASSP
jgi:malate dehydrogenase